MGASMLQSDEPDFGGLRRCTAGEGASGWKLRGDGRGIRPSHAGWVGTAEDTVGRPDCGTSEVHRAGWVHAARVSRLGARAKLLHGPALGRKEGGGGVRKR